MFSGDYSAEVLIPKKDCFRDKDENVNMDLLVDHVGQPIASWKEKLVGSSSNIGGEDLEVKEDFEVLEGDIQKSIINVQPWAVSFDPTQTFLSMVMSWIRFSGFSGYMYKRKILLEIRRLVGKVTMLDMNTDNRVRGRFARMAIYVTLDRPLVSQVLINGKIQRVENEFLLKVCFYHGRYGRMKNVCPFTNSEPRVGKNLSSFETLQVIVSMTIEETIENGGSYRPWMLVKKRSW
ncbi:hypothetical protein PVK06_010978 [Gossypium arboreum]|uniref:DUF4283 domain-containing protein n=1 Tax=Gossypium arboreum TaxID=29729 RepID=A0ABR0Q7P8_GOSAR|nr:hypothetical protein PVK06_010978 [Gossypium arboreum]